MLADLLGELEAHLHRGADHAARYARRSLDMDGRYVRGRAFNLALLATAHAAQDEPERACSTGRQALDLTEGSTPIDPTR